jgi:hypothetical protein
LTTLLDQRTIGSDHLETPGDHLSLPASVVALFSKTDMLAEIATSRIGHTTRAMKPALAIAPSVLIYAPGSLFSRLGLVTW